MEKKLKLLRLIQILIWVSAAALAAETPKTSIAVLDLDATGISSQEAKTLTDRLRSELFSIGTFDVMEREKMNEMTKEQRLQSSGIVSDEMVVEIGKVIGVKNMVAGSIGKLGAKYLLNLRLVNVESGKIMATASEECECQLEELSSAMDKMALQLSGKAIRKNVTIKYTGVRSTRQRGNFYIKSTPVGASVYLNGKRQNGYTPLIIEDIPTGKYHLRVETGDYAGEVTVEVEDNQFKTLDLNLKKKTGSLRIETNVPNADIYIAEKYQGKSPLRLDSLVVGSYPVKIIKSQYLEKVQTVKIKERKETFLKVELKKPGPVKILSIPLEAEVFLDGEKRGLTPMIISDFPRGEHKLELRKEEYRPFQTTVSVETHEETKLEPTLVPIGSPDPKVKKANESPGDGADRIIKWIVLIGGVGFVAALTTMSLR
jgi:TolB-like protein